MPKYNPKVEAYVELGDVPMSEAWELLLALRRYVAEFDADESVVEFTSSLEEAYEQHDELPGLVSTDYEDDGGAVA